MAITMLQGDIFGVVRYFQSDRCMNNKNLQKFNRGKIKAKELVTFDCGLMELKEVEGTGIELLQKNEQLLAVIVRPEIEPSVKLGQEDRFEFCGYDLVDVFSSISAITNCGAEFDSIDYAALNKYGLLPSYRAAVTAQLERNEKYPEHPHTYCEIVEIWRCLPEQPNCGGRGHT